MKHIFEQFEFRQQQQEEGEGRNKLNDNKELLENSDAVLIVIFKECDTIQ